MTKSNNLGERATHSNLEVLPLSNVSTLGRSEMPHALLQLLEREMIDPVTVVIGTTNRSEDLDPCLRLCGNPAGYVGYEGPGGLFDVTRGGGTEFVRFIGFDGVDEGK